LDVVLLEIRKNVLSLSLSLSLSVSLLFPLPVNFSSSFKASFCLLTYSLPSQDPSFLSSSSISFISQL